MKHFTSTLFLLVLALGTFAQADYEFSTFSETYVELENGTLVLDQTWDDPNYVVPIGFDINLMGTTTGNLYSNSEFLGGTLIANDLLPQWDMLWVTTLDIIDAGYANDEMLSPITYATQGEPGNRIFKMQWEGVGFYDEYSDNGTANNKMNFQLWLYESDGAIEYRFGPNSVKELQYVTSTWNNCGLINDATSDENFNGALFLSGMANAPSTVEVNDIDDFFSAQLMSVPENGRVYRFEPGVLSTPSIQTEAQFKVYPTVTNDLVRIDGLSPETAEISILDLSGKLIDRSMVNSNQPISLGHLSEGLYLIRIQQGAQIKTQRVIRRD